MPPSLFTTLCDIADALDRLARDLEPGPVQDRLHALLERVFTPQPAAQRE